MAAYESAQIEYDVQSDVDVRIPIDGGAISLSAAIYRPLTDEPVPAVVAALPYRKDVQGGTRGMLGLLRSFAAAGYASLLIDFRGTGSSDGVCRPEGDPREADDILEVFDWLGDQDWCNGSVGMWGHSYGALITLRVASRRPSALKAIIPVQGPADISRYVAHPDGTRGDMHSLLNRGASMLSSQIMPPLLDYHSPEEQRRWVQRLADFEPAFVNYVSRRPGDPQWQDWRIDTAHITTPALCIGGWRDVHCEGMTRAFEEIAGRKRLIMGPWLHLLPHTSAVAPVDFPELAIRWWDRWLKNRDNGADSDPEVVLHLPTEVGEAWRSFSSWPPPGEARAFTGCPDGTLEEGVESGALALGVYSPDPTTGALSGMWGTGFTCQESDLDQHDDDVRSLFWTSSPLLSPQLVVGRPRVRLNLDMSDEASARSVIPRVVIRLSAVDAKGRSRFIAGGVGLALPRNDAAEIELRPAAYLLRPGERLRATLSDADFPRLNPLIDAPEIIVRALEVILPTLPEGAGSPTQLAPSPELALDGAAASRPLGDGAGIGTFEVARDHSRGSVTVRLGSSAHNIQSPAGHSVGTQNELWMSVPHHAPEAMTGASAARTKAVLTTGETIEVEATVRVTHTALWAAGRVDINGSVVFERRWMLEIPTA